MKQITFEKSGYEQWKELAVQSLKGKPFDTLITTTIEDIDIQPLYIEGGNANFSSIIREQKTNAGWTIAQGTYASNGAEWVFKVQESIEKGNEAIVYDGWKQMEWDETSLEKASELFTKYPIHFINIRKDDPILHVFNRIPEMNRKSVNGFIQTEQWNYADKFPNLRKAGADLWDIHHEGADAVTELSIALAKAAHLSNDAESFEMFAANFYVRFAIDTHFFMEIAKLRAFRVLFHAFAEAYGVKNYPPVQIAAVTSLRSFSKLDPYNNLLRAGNEAFAAVLGGADIITVHPHDVLTGPTNSSIRYSRNIQLILKEETHVGKVADPAGGSYFIEQLTKELVEKAWELFIDIEQNGGLNAFIASGRLAEQMDKRKAETATAKKALIGINVYADSVAEIAEDWSGIKAFERIASPFEMLHKQTAYDQPKTVLLNFGTLKDYKPRADYVTGFLSTGGIQCEWSPSFVNAAEAIDWIHGKQVDYAIICAKDDIAQTVVNDFLNRLPEEMIVDVAGKFDNNVTNSWTAKGLNGFIYKGQNILNKIESILDKWKGEADHE